MPFSKVADERSESHRPKGPALHHLKPARASERSPSRKPIGWRESVGVSFASCRLWTHRNPVRKMGTGLNSRG